MSVGEQRMNVKFEAYFILLEDRLEFTHLTLGRTHKLIPPPWYKGEGGVGTPPPWVFVGLRYFEKVIPAIDILLCRLHD